MAELHLFISSRLHSPNPDFIWLWWENFLSKSDFDFDSLTLAVKESGLFQFVCPWSIGGLLVHVYEGLSETLQGLRRHRLFLSLPPCCFCFLATLTAAGNGYEQVAVVKAARVSGSTGINVVVVVEVALEPKMLWSRDNTLQAKLTITHVSFIFSIQTKWAINVAFWFYFAACF